MGQRCNVPEYYIKGLNFNLLVNKFLKILNESHLGFKLKWSKAENDWCCHSFLDFEEIEQILGLWLSD